MPRRRARPVTASGEVVPRGRPIEVEEREPVGTLERYSSKNEDGSFTFGYISADGSFKEETRGADCITRGKYGYIDPEGVKREYSYTAGLPCEIGAEGENSLQSEDGSVVDTVDPTERFRQTSSVQLSEDEIPARPALRQRVRQRTQATNAPAVAAEAPAQNAFANFGNQGGRGQIPQRRPVPARTSGSALDSLLNIADGSAAAPAVPARQQRPRPAAPANPGTFDFDSELEGFTLNRPALSFEQSKSQGAGSGASFQSQLVFNQNTGTFQTELRQAGQPNQANAAAPFTRTTSAPATTFAASPRPTSLRPAPTPAGVRPAGTFSFEPLTFPAPSPAPPAPAAPAPATVRLPAPTPAAPRPTTVFTPAPASRPTAPTATPSGAPPANTFFVFQPFNQQGAPAPSPQPASAPFNTAFNPNAFQIRPAQQQPGQPQPAGAPFRPNPFPQPIPFPQRQRPTPAAAAPTPAAVPAAAPAAAPAPVQQVRQPAPAPVQQFRQPAPVPSQGFQQQARPQLQFGFQPVQQGQQQNRPAPFTAFRAGPPPQIQAFQQQPQQLSQQPQLGVPPQLQGQRFAPPQGSRPQQFSVFGQAPQAFRGA